MRFAKIIGSTWVLDTLLNVQWSTTLTPMLWQDAMNYAANNGARLPTVEELSDLVDYSKYDPSIDKDFFPDTLHDWYWTGTERNNKKEDAYAISFVGGCVVGHGKEGVYSFRMVKDIE